MKFPQLTKLTVIILSFVFTIPIFSSNAFACDCSGPTGKQAIRKGSAAFRGTVINIKYLDPKTSKSEPRIAIAFAVSRYWSGNVKESFILHTTENRFSCAGYYFVEGKEYLVVAHPNGEGAAKSFDGGKNTFGTDPCGSALPIEMAKNQLKELGKGKKTKR